jgi:anthranilate synthase component 2
MIMQRILVIDNYDSFTYNLVHCLKDLHCEVSVRRNDKLQVSEAGEFDKILLSPGPGIPDEAGQLKKIIEEWSGKKSILGICLGQQAIAEVFGGSLKNLAEVYHGVSTEIDRVGEDEALYRGLPRKMEVGRYHSWVVSRELPESLEVTSVDKAGEIMSLRHREYDVRAVQYHPESILTPHGMNLLKNWVEHTKEPGEKRKNTR